MYIEVYGSDRNTIIPEAIIDDPLISLEVKVNVFHLKFIKKLLASKDPEWLDSKNYSSETLKQFNNQVLLELHPLHQTAFIEILRELLKNERIK